MAKWQMQNALCILTLSGIRGMIVLAELENEGMYTNPVVYPVMMMCSAMAVSHGYLALRRNRIL